MPSDVVHTGTAKLLLQRPASSEQPLEGSTMDSRSQVCVQIRDWNQFKLNEPSGSMDSA